MSTLNRIGPPADTGNGGAPRNGGVHDPPDPTVDAVVNTPAVRRPKARRRVLFAVALTGAALLAVWALRPAPLTVDPAVVDAGPLEETIEGEGITRVRNRYDVTAPVAGLLQRSQLRAGDEVTAGAVLARITPVPLDALALTAVRARVSAAQATHDEAGTRLAQSALALEQLERSTARLRTVSGTGSISVDAMERSEVLLAAARTEFEAAGARRAAAAAELNAALAALPAPAAAARVTLVRSPAHGRVLRLLGESERVVPAGTPLLAVGDPRALEVVVDVLSTDAVRVRPGALIRLLDWGGAEALAAAVERVEPHGVTRMSALGVEEQRVNVIGTVHEPPAGLGDGFSVQAHIVTWSAPDVVRVPGTALFRSGDGWSVFVVERGRARLRSVVLGHRNAAYTEVLDGLRPGAEVILFPSDRMRAGDRVRRSTPPPAGT